MGNCQAAEAATVVIQHPGGKVERVYWSTSASQVMAANPGHYVAVIITTPPPPASNPSDSSTAANTPVKHLKLLRPDDTLHIGHVYRLVSFEEVLREFASKRHVKLSRLLAKQQEKPSSRRGEGRGRGRRGGGGGCRGSKADAESSPASSTVAEQRAEEETGAVGVQQEEIGSIRRVGSRHGQWRPALQSIAELGS